VRGVNEEKGEVTEGEGWGRARKGEKRKIRGGRGREERERGKEGE